MIKAFMMRFPEFTESMEDGDKELVMATLKAAESELNSRIWGTLFEEGVLYLAADKLTRSRLGEHIRSSDNSAAKSVYAVEFERLAFIASMGARVV